MAVAQDDRPQFFQDQYLGPEDLAAAVEYSRIHQARHSLGAHTWGIAIGLQLLEKPSAAGNNQVDVFIQPGYAWDGFGRPLVALVPELDDYLRPDEARARFARVPQAEVVAVDKAKHLWVGEPYVRIVLNEIVRRVNPRAWPLPTEWKDSP